MRGGLGGIDEETTDAKQSLVGAKQSLVKDQIKQDLFKLSTPIFHELMIKIKSFLREAILCDPDMFRSWRNAIGSALDQFLDDIEHEIGRNLTDAWFRKQQNQKKELKTNYAILRPLYRFRAFVLYHYLPHDKMLFGRLKDPWYLLMYVLTCLPVHGVRVVFFLMVLLMMILPGPADEYQVINFILLCKGMQFLSSGIVQTAKAAIMYFYCYRAHRDRDNPLFLMDCIDNYGPGAHDGYGLAMDYLGSIMLVWVAYGLLPRSIQHAQSYRSSFESEATTDQRNREAGGRFYALLRYDWKCFAASGFVLLLLILPISVPKIWEKGLEAIPELQSNPLFNASMFWCCVLYSLTSLPFFPFMIAGLQEAMTHCYATGYNQHGACVPYEGVMLDPEQVEEKPPGETTGRSRLRPGKTFVMKAGAKGLQLMQAGAQARGETSALNLKPTDLFWGVWHEHIVKRRKSTGDQPPEGQTESPDGANQGFFWGRESEVLEDDGYEYGEQMHFSIAYAGIPTDKMQEDYGGQAAFVVEVEAGLGVDGERAAASESAYVFSGDADQPNTESSGYSKKWYVVRRFHEFEALADRLGPRCKRFPDAQFPARTLLGTVKGSELEQRRSQLEAWLAQVMVDEKCNYETWNKKVSGFLTENIWHQADINRILRRSSEDEPKNLPQKISEDIMPGPLERAKPLAREKPFAPKKYLDQTAAAGRVARGGVADGQYKFGDYSYGLWSNLSAPSCVRAPQRLATANFDEDLEDQDLDSEADRQRLAQGNHQPL